MPSLLSNFYLFAGFDTLLLQLLSMGNTKPLAGVDTILVNQNQEAI